MFTPPKKETTNKITSDAGHFVRTELDSTDLRKENLISKSRKNNKTWDFYKKEMPKKIETDETIRLLDEIASFNPGKKCTTCS